MIRKKTKKSASKRFKQLAKKWIIKHWGSNTSHLAFSKTSEQKARLKKPGLLSTSDLNRLKKMFN